MPEENGWSEPYRVRLPRTVEADFMELAKIENRSMPSLIQSLAIEAYAKRKLESRLSDTIKSIMLGNGGKW